MNKNVVIAHERSFHLKSFIVSVLPFEEGSKFPNMEEAEWWVGGHTVTCWVGGRWR